MRRAVNYVKDRLNVLAAAALVALCVYFAIPREEQHADIGVLMEASIKHDLNAFRAEFAKGLDAKTLNSLNGHLKSTPAHFAAMAGEKEMLRMLLDAGVNVDLRALDDTTPLLSAATLDHADTIKFLLSKGADVNAEAHTGSFGLTVVTPLTIASSAGH